MLIDFLEKGGPILWAIGVISIIGVGFFFERFIYLCSIRRRLLKTGDVIKKLARQGKINQIRAICRDGTDPFSGIVLQMIQMIRDGKEVNSETLSLLVYSELSKTEKNFTILRTFITISPLMGLFGTVTGMIKIFKSIEPSDLHGSVLYKTQLAGGISEALYTTVGGLVVAILLSILLSVLHEMRSRYESRMMESLHGILGYIKNLEIREALR
ncbi:MAG: hypothetical protein DRP30_04020 [Thermotoga sp.]|nr:MAG: hypothetical protein DRP30_04020 [Thermotoga sp.]